MEYLILFWENFTNIDNITFGLANELGAWIYIFIFFIIFIETGFFMALFLPEESLLFSIGALAAIGIINFSAAISIIIAASILGDSFTYIIGRKIGEKILNRDKERVISKKYIIKASEFYKNNGDKSVVIGRIVPLVRSFIPFTVGMSGMKYSKFMFLNILGSVSWIVVYVGLGYFFGNIQLVKNNFSIVIILIVVVSIIPLIISFLRKKSAERAF